MGNVIPFPGPRERNVRVTLEAPPIPMDRCSEFVHVFTEVPGRCQCGENEWEPGEQLADGGIGIHAVE